jgi:hypothetical protein
MKTQNTMLEGMATKTTPRKDLNELAFSILRQATGEVTPEPIDEKKKAAQESGRRGGLIGGAVRASKLTPAHRSEIAKKAAEKRWETTKGR